MQSWFGDFLLLLFFLRAIYLFRCLSPAICPNSVHIEVGGQVGLHALLVKKSRHREMRGF